uniref:Ig-like domain-containing protein n=1 Tax=Oreochromis niloticus TaxID=8128 RepID=A0A669B3X6_ORENI
MTVWPGQNATLECRGSSDLMISVVQWRKPDLKPDSYVFFYRKPHSYENYQHESFKGRVDLREPSMKDGDASVILRNVSISDTGTYECEIITSNTRSGERVIREFKHSINLTVTDAGEFVEIYFIYIAPNHTTVTSRHFNSNGAYTPNAIEASENAPNAPNVTRAHSHLNACPGKIHRASKLHLSTRVDRKCGRKLCQMCCAADVL